jgi:hypothetical protein
MSLIEAAWVGPGGEPRPDLPAPQIQIMAPPRVPRVSDYDEHVDSMTAAEAEQWARGSQAPGVYRLNDMIIPSQEQTPAGRGIVLTPVGLLESQLRGLIPQGLINFGAGDHYRARVERPYTCDLTAWGQHLKKIRAEARNLGMAMENEPAAEWWLDRNGYDGVIFTRAQARYHADRALIVFRRAQLVRITTAES